MLDALKLLHHIKYDDPLLKPRIAAELLNMKPQTLATWRHLGDKRLPWVKVGRSVRYRLSDVRTFIQNNLHLNEKPIKEPDNGGE